MRYLALIGHLDQNGNNLIGAVVKARSLLKELQLEFGKKNVYPVDIYNWRKNIVSVSFNIINAFINCKHIVLVISDTSGLLMKVLAILKKMFGRRIWYVVVGGDIGDILENNTKNIELLRFVDCFFVETPDCKEQLENLNIKNVKVMLNFKHIVDHSEKKPNNSIQPFAFCTFSRVNREKGIMDAIWAVNEINNFYKEEKCILHIYGPVENDYKNEFNKELSNSSYCIYKGLAPSEKAKTIISNYYCLLFPTHYQTEGIPGTIIDAFSAGVPVISSGWKRCKYIVTNDYDGIVYSFSSKEALKMAMIDAIEHPLKVFEMGKNAQHTYEKYRPENAIKVLLCEMRKVDK